MNIDKNANKIISLLLLNGFQAYAVGGCVRDYIMDRPCDDIDITTSATPEDAERVLDDNDIHYIETGMKHGTVTAIIDNNSYEITTFRADGDYVDSRHPKTVKFINSVNGDLARRDFTMNAVAYNDADGFIDPFDGKKDIGNKIIKAVGCADTRFKEDALRIMRAVRFASTLSFDIDPDTEKAVLDNRQLLLNVSYERIYTELKKLLCGGNVFNVLIKYRDIIAVVIPELKETFDLYQNSKWHIYDVYTHIAKSVEAAPRDPELRLVMLLHDIGKPYCKTVDVNGADHFYGHPAVSAKLAQKVLKRLKVSNDTMDRVLTLVRVHDSFIKPDDKSILKHLHAIGESSTRDLIEIKKADLSAQNLTLTGDEILQLDETKVMLNNLIENKAPFRLSDLAVNGCDLISMGYRKIEIGSTLNMLLDKVISGELPNDKEALLASIENKLDSI